MGYFIPLIKICEKKIRRFNNDVFYITDSLFRMVNYYKLMCDSENETNKIIYEKNSLKSSTSCEGLVFQAPFVKSGISITLPPHFKDSSDKHVTTIHAAAS